MLAIPMTLALLSVHQIAPPSANPAELEFSVARAMSDLQQIAREPHPLGSVEHKRVLRYLTLRLQALGLSPEIQRGTFVAKSGARPIVVQNLLAIVPGTTPGQAVLLTAHYDSVPGSPGAADNGAAVAALLETIRILGKQGPLKHDIIVLFSDAEEVNLLGARLFQSNSSWFKRIGVVVNFDFRGNSGPVWLFETGKGSLHAVAAWTRARLEHRGNSLLSEAYQYMPNRTDFTIYKEAGLPGLNFAAAGHPEVYHTAQDRTGGLDPSTFQHLGQTMLAMAVEFGNNMPAVASADDAVFFNFPWLGAISYSPAYVWILCIPVLLMTALASALAIRSSQACGRRIALAIPLAAGLGATLALLAPPIWATFSALEIAWSNANGVSQGGEILALLGIEIILGQAALKWVARWLNPLELALGAATLWCGLLVVACWRVPGASFAMTWPLFPVLIVMLLRSGRPTNPIAHHILFQLAYLPGIVILSEFVYTMQIALGPAALPFTMGIAQIYFFMLQPLRYRRPRS